MVPSWCSSPGPNYTCARSPTRPRISWPRASNEFLSRSDYWLLDDSVYFDLFHRFGHFGRVLRVHRLRESRSAIRMKAFLKAVSYLCRCPHYGATRRKLSSSSSALWPEPSMPPSEHRKIRARKDDTLSSVHLPHSFDDVHSFFCLHPRGYTFALPGGRVDHTMVSGLLSFSSCPAEERESGTPCT